MPSKTCANSCQYFCLHSPATGAWLSIPKIWVLEWWNADSYSCSYWENQSTLAEKAYHKLHQLLLALLCFPISDFWLCSQHPLLPEEHTSPYCLHASIHHQSSLLNSTSTHLTFTFQFLELFPSHLHYNPLHTLSLNIAICCHSSFLHEIKFHWQHRMGFSFPQTIFYLPWDVIGRKAKRKC